MKNIKYKLGIFLSFAIILSGCQDDNYEVGALIAPSNIKFGDSEIEIVGIDATHPDGDGSGFVNFSVTADNTITYKFNFGDNSEEVSSTGKVTHRFLEVGTNEYTVTVIASGTGGIQSSASKVVKVFSSFDDQEAKDFLSGGSSRTWYLDYSKLAYLGLGPAFAGVDGDWWYPKWFVADAAGGGNDKCDGNDPTSYCLCDDELTFTLDGNNRLTYQLNNNGQTYFHNSYKEVAGEVNGGSDACYDFDTSGISQVSFAPSSTGIPEAAPLEEYRGTVMNFSNNGFMGYYVGSSSYEILEVTDTTLYVRVIQGNDPVLAWYHKFTTER